MPKEAKVKATDATVTKTKRAKKDKDAPKRPLSAYMFFSQDHRDKVRADNAEASFGEIGRILGAKWKDMSDKEKAPYQAKADKDKTRASTEKEAYEKANGGKKKKAKKSKADDSD